MGPFRRTLKRSDMVAFAFAFAFAFGFEPSVGCSAAVSDVVAVVSAQSSVTVLSQSEMVDGSVRVLQSR